MKTWMTILDEDGDCLGDQHSPKVIPRRGDHIAVPSGKDSKGQEMVAKGNVVLVTWIWKFQIIEIRVQTTIRGREARKEIARLLGVKME